MIQKRIDKLQPYLKGLKIADDYKIVEFTIKKSWSIEDNEEIQATQKESKEGELYTMFYSITKSFDEILDFVEEKVVKYNLELEEKERLLKAKVEELKRVFETKSLDELNHLKFTTEEDSLKLNSKTNITIVPNGTNGQNTLVKTTTNDTKIEKVS